MFFGQYRHNVDEKGRLMVPARFRDVLAAAGAYVMEGFDRNLMVMTTSTFERITDQVAQTNLLDPKARKLSRKIFSNAYAVDVDRAGRILLPLNLRPLADLETEVIVVGVGDYFELWSPANWASQVEMLRELSADNQGFENLELSAR
jgi:MraZ protein